MDDRQHLCSELLLAKHTIVMFVFTEGVVLIPYGMKKSAATSTQSVQLTKFDKFKFMIKCV